MQKIIAFALVLALGALLGRQTSSVRRDSKKAEPFKTSLVPTCEVDASTSKQNPAGRAPAEAVVQANLTDESSPKIKFAELAEYYERQSFEFRLKNIESHAPYHHLNAREVLLEDQALAQKTTLDFENARSQSLYWKASGSFVEAGHTVEILILISLPGEPSMLKNENTGEEFQPTTCTRYSRVYLVDGKQVGFPFSLPSDCGVDFRYRGNQAYINDEIFGTSTEVPITMLLFPLPIGPGGDTEYFSSADERWTTVSNFRWEKATEDDEKNFVKEHSPQYEGGGTD